MKTPRRRKERKGKKAPVLESESRDDTDGIQLEDERVGDSEENGPAKDKKKRQTEKELVTENEIERMLDEKIVKMLEQDIEKKIEKVETLIKEKVEQCIEAKIKEKLKEKIEERLAGMLGDKIEQMIQDKIEKKIAQMVEDKLKGKIEEEIEDQGKGITEEKIKEIVEEKIEEKIEEEMGNMDEGIEERLKKGIEAKTEEISAKKRTNGKWSTARGRTRRESREYDSQVPVSNRFSVLGEEGVEKEDIRYLVVGDSRARPLERVLCEGRDKCVIRPGATVAEVGSAVQQQLKKCDPEVIIVHVGVNDVGPRRSVKLLNDYHALLRTLREARRPTIVTGILPRGVASNEWYSRAIAANSSVQSMCANMGLHFVDLWQEFFGRETYYLRDGLHLSDEGARALGCAYERIIKGN